MLENDETALIKEVCILNPTEASNLMHDELMLYKHSHENLMIDIKEKKEKILNYEIIIKVIIIYKYYLILFRNLMRKFILKKKKIYLMISRNTPN